MEKSKEYIKNEEELERLKLKDRVKKLETTVEVLEALCNMYAKSMGISIERLPGENRIIVISQI